MPKDTTPLPQATVRAVLRREFTDFFTRMRTAEGRWPAISDQEFTDALADSLLATGKATGKGVAFAQTLVHELQDRVNDELNQKG